MPRSPRSRPDCESRAPSAFAGPIQDFLNTLALERSLSPNTEKAYGSDLDQCAAFLARQGASDWSTVRGEQAAAWVHSLSVGEYTPASLARKLTALRVFARHLVREKVREDDFTALLSAPKLGRRIPGTLSTDDISRLPWLVRHSRRTLSVIRQNIAFSLGVKAVFLILTFAGMASLWGAIAADVGASLLVVFNALRLLNGGAHPEAPAPLTIGTRKVAARA